MRRAARAARGGSVAVLAALLLPASAGAGIRQDGPRPAAAATLSEALTLEELEARALERHPALREATARIRAAEGRRRQAALWPNPTVGVAAAEVPVQEEREGGQFGFFLSQEVPLGGKLKLDRQVSDRAVSAALAEAERRQLAILSRLRGTFYRAVAAQRLAELRSRLAALAAEAVETTSQLFNTGAADRADLLAAGIEAESARLALAAARRELERLWEEIHSAVGDADLERLPLEDRLADLPLLDEAEWRARVLEESPEVAAAEARLAGAEGALARARRESVPDLELTAGVQEDREEVAPGGPILGRQVFAEVGVRVPLFDRNQGGIAAAEAEVEAARAELEATRLDLRARFAPAYASYRQGYEAAAAYRQRILGQAEEAYEMYLVRYRQMAAAYPQVLIAQRTLFQAEAAYVGWLVQAWEGAVAIRGLLVVEEAGGAGAREPGDGWAAGE